MSETITENNEAVVRAEQTLRALVAKRDRAAARADQLSEARKQIGFAVFADGDKSARKRLDEINLSSATLTGELEALEAAISEANSRLAAAKAAENRAADETKARALLELADAFDVEVGKLAEASDTLVAACNAIVSLHAKISANGAQRPSRQQIDVMLGRVIATVIMRSGLQHQAGTSFLAPRERRAATDLLLYGRSIRADANARIIGTNQRAA